MTLIIAIIGIPGGLDVRHEKLKELKKSEVIDFYEIFGRDIRLYWRGMESKKKIKFTIDVVASIPGEFVGPASCAYLYYTNEHKMWVGGLKCQVNPKEENNLDTMEDSPFSSGYLIKF
jgi:alpha-2-macroglobulin-like protein